jgi:alkylation response protein AidB-like acyl-CoA dehydrogenase
MESRFANTVKQTLKTLPGDDVRQIMWRYADRFDLAMLVQSVRPVARGPVARLVAQGGRNFHEWTPEKNSLLAVYDEAGITASFLDPAQGGFIEGPKNLALALVALELAWVDGGAATCSLAGNLGLAPIHECGTPEQRDHYMSRCAPAKPGENRKIERAAFALTEPLPFVGVETSMLSGKVHVAEWKDGDEPMLQVDKRGRFITNMGFANIVTAAVESTDKRIKGSCMIILEETDPGVFDRGVATKKLVHQLSSTCDPVFSLHVPASRIIGGYTVKDGVIIPNRDHSDIIETVFRRTRVTVSLMTSAKLLSSVEPIIRYQRTRFRGGDVTDTSSPRYALGLQQKQDALHRLVDVWATGEAGASLGFAAARMFDELDPLEKAKDALFVKENITSARAQLKALAKSSKDALEYLALLAAPEDKRDATRFAVLQQDPMVAFLLLDAQANVFCPACKLWNTGYGATMMREAVSLMGGYGVTEDCPGFLGNKWMDAQLEATYEGPESVQRRQLTVTMCSDVFLALFKQWIADLHRIASEKPATGAGTLASSMEMWLWTLNHLQNSTDANGARLYHGTRQGVTFPMADTLCWLIASRSFLLDMLELELKGPANPALAEGLEGLIAFMTDLCHVHCARAAGETGRVCAELVYGYNGPQSNGLEPFARMRASLDGCLTGSRLAKDRAAEALTQVMIPEALDYPA